MVKIESWGCLTADLHQLSPLLHSNATSLPLDCGCQGLPHGMARSYGDVCLNPGGVLWTTRKLDRLISWNEETGALTCEAGVLIRDIQQLFVPRGWMLPVVPGTQLITLGGAIANDVHGKNHHRRGTFGHHVCALRLLRTDGMTVDCGPALQPDWFAATVGGLGLTGVITQATLKLRRVPCNGLDVESQAFSGLDEFFALVDAATEGWEHTVAWLDCLAHRNVRGIFTRANPASSADFMAHEVQRNILPGKPPISLVNRFGVRAFNAAYFHAGRRKIKRSVHYASFFHPLDRWSGWNWIYGRKGFYQYQCVIPRPGSKEALESMLHEIRESGEVPFLGVLKTFGSRPSPGMLSFVRPGVTLALDFPNHGDSTHRLLAQLDSIVKQAGGRLYPAKDARMPRSLFEAGYPMLLEFSRYRDPGISSAFSRRIMGS